jgi:hypothetical protein
MGMVSTGYVALQKIRCYNRVYLLQEYFLITKDQTQFSRYKITTHHKPLGSAPMMPNPGEKISGLARLRDHQ